MTRVFELTYCLHDRGIVFAVCCKLSECWLAIGTHKRSAKLITRTDHTDHLLVSKDFKITRSLDLYCLYTSRCSTSDRQENTCLWYRSSQHSFKRWQGQVESASQDIKGVISTMRGAWQETKDRLDQLAHTTPQNELLHSVQQVS